MCSQFNLCPGIYLEGLRRNKKASVATGHVQAKIQLFITKRTEVTALTNFLGEMHMDSLTDTQEEEVIKCIISNASKKIK
jgi:hypothetical protein